MSYLVDSHCHLNFPQLKDQISQLIERAANNNVRVMQTICTKMSEFDEICGIAEQYDELYCSVGVHPHETDSEQVRAEQLIAAAQHPKVIGIGETGLDYYYEHSDREAQKLSFREHINASRQTGLPLIIHARDADEDTMDILEDEYAFGAFPILIHCFTASKMLADRALALGGYISISGIITFNSAKTLQETVKTIPLERLLVETDAPYLAPTPHRGKDNEPSFTLHTAEFLAQLKETSLEQLTKTTTNNFFTLFSKATPLKDE